eukprot:scaffold175918_cov57-Attheya_sp.AAC.2
MVNAINDDEIVETGDHDTGNLDESERDFPSLKFYNAVDGSTSLEKFRDCLSCNKIEDISQLTYDEICSLKLKKRDQGSTSLERKSKSLQQRWFTKGNSNSSKQGKMPIEEKNKDTYVEHDSLIELMCKQGKGDNQSETAQLYRVLALFDKHYNKWYICERKY